MNYLEMFDVPFKMDNGMNTTVAGIIESMGHGAVDMDKFRASGAAEAISKMMEANFHNSDEHAPNVIAYWAKKGLIKEFHGEDRLMDWDDYCRRNNYSYDLSRAYPQNLYKKWVSFVPASAFRPENAGRKYPTAVVLHGGGNTVYTIDGWGFPNTAAEREWILIVPSLEIDEVIEEILTEARSLYPIDEERTYVCGFSFGSINTNILAHKHPNWWAAAAPCGGTMTDGTYGRKMRDLLVQRQKRLEETGMPDVSMKEPDLDFKGPYRSLESGKRMPIISVIGDCDGDNYPVYDTGYLDDVVAGYNLWAEINDAEPFEIEKILAVKGNTFVTHAEASIGLPFEDGCTSTWTKDGIVYNAGDVKSRDGVVRMRFISEENVPHWPTPELSRQLFDFFSKFRRDSKTGESVYEP